MIGWLLFPPPASRHFIEASRIPQGVRGRVAFSLVALCRCSLRRQVSRGPQGRDGGACGPVSFQRVSGQDTGERWRRAERGWVHWIPRLCRAGAARSWLTFGGLCVVAVPLSRGRERPGVPGRPSPHRPQIHGARARLCARSPWRLLSLVPLRSHYHCHLRFSSADVWKRALGLIDITQEGLPAHHGP